jgi:hypothetical protein
MLDKSTVRLLEVLFEHLAISSAQGREYSVPPVGVRNFGQQVCIRSLNFQRGPKPTAILFG